MCSVKAERSGRCRTRYNDDYVYVHSVRLPLYGCFAGRNFVVIELASVLSVNEARVLGVRLAWGICLYNTSNYQLQGTIEGLPLTAYLLHKHLNVKRAYMQIVVDCAMALYTQSNANSTCTDCCAASSISIIGD